MRTWWRWTDPPHNSDTPDLAISMVAQGRAWLCPAATRAAPDKAMAICLHTTKMRWLQPGEAAMMNARGGDLNMLLDDDDSAGGSIGSAT